MVGLMAPAAMIMLASASPSEARLRGTCLGDDAVVVDGALSDRVVGDRRHRAEDDEAVRVEGL